MAKVAKKSYNRLWIILLGFLAVLGIVLMFYPLASGYFSDYGQNEISKAYVTQTQDIDEELLNAARNYNANLNSQNHEDYLSQLTVSGSEIMAVLEIPSVGIVQPVYHTDSTEVLMKGIGHMEGTALPVGGEGNTAVLSGHTAVPGKPFFDRLHDVAVGEIVLVKVAGEALAYDVVSSEILAPHEVEILHPVAGKDRLVLVTCTPYAVNSHRLVVVAERVDYVPETIEFDAGLQDWDRLWWIPGLIISVAVVGVLSAWGFRAISRK